MNLSLGTFTQCVRVPYKRERERKRRAIHRNMRICTETTQAQIYTITHIDVYMYMLSRGPTFRPFSEGLKDCVECNLPVIYASLDQKYYNFLSIITTHSTSVSQFITLKSHSNSH